MFVRLEIPQSTLKERRRYFIVLNFVVCSFVISGFESTFFMMIKLQALFEAWVLMARLKAAN